MSMKLIGKVAGVSLSLAGKPLVTFEFESRDALEQMTDERLTVEIKKYKEKRSLDANAYAWVLIGRLSETLGRPKTEIYRKYVKEIGHYEVYCARNDEAAKRLCEAWETQGIGWVTETYPSKIDGCVNCHLHYGSSSYDSAQMARLIDLIVEDCKAQGIETDTPEEIARMVGDWK